MKIKDIHDGFFYDIESNPENMGDLIQGTVTKSLVSTLNLTSLKLEHTTYIDEPLKKVFSDLVYTCEHKAFNKTVRVALLFEHKSYSVEYPHIQLLKYMSNILTETLRTFEKKKKEKNEKPNFIITIPIIFYHGNKKWKRKEFYEYFDLHSEDLDKLRQFIPEFNYILTDMNKYSLEEIQTTLFKRDINKVVMSLFKLSGEEIIDMTVLENILKLGRNHFLSLKTDDELQNVLLYALSIFKIDPNKLKEMIYKIMRGKEELVMTTAEQLMETGMETGEVKGAKKRNEAITLNMLKEGFDYNMIHKCTELPTKDIKEIEERLKLLK